MKCSTLRGFLVVFLPCAIRPVLAQEGPVTPWVGERGITETVAAIMERERLRPPGPHHQELDREVIRFEQPPIQNPDSPSVAHWPPLPDAVSPGGRRSPRGVPPPATGLPVSVGVSFLAVDSTESPYVPPDTGGAVGPTQILLHENGRVKVFDKLGNAGPLNADADVFFNSVRNNSAAVDPQTKYDRISGRFIVTAINVTTPNRVLIAVSSGSTITGAGSFTFFQFTQDAVVPIGNVGEFADYDKVGVDANAVYIGTNMFGSGFSGSNCFVVRKTSILSGGPIIVTAFRGIADPSGVGPLYPMGVDNDDPASTEGYVAGVDGSMFGRIAIRRISSPGGTPSISGNLFVTTPTTTFPIQQPALGSTNPLDTLDYAILFDVQMHRDRSTGLRTLWCAQNIEVDASGVATAGGGRNGSRWHQIGNLATTPTLVQSGTLFDASGGANPKGYILPSCAMSGQGIVLLGATFAGNNDRAGCALATRVASDAPGTISAPNFAVVSANSYNAQAASPQRWGDMSKVDVDPTDDQTLWAFAEYCSADNEWGVRVIQLRAPLPTTPTVASPPSLPQGATGQLVVLTGPAVGGSAYYDTEPGYNRLQASFSGTGVTVTNVAYNSPTQITLTVDVGAGAPTGPRTITLTNPDGQSATSANGIVSVDVGAPAIPYCFGDGSILTPCPCSNFGGSGRGCANSANSAGAVLGSSGTISPDTVVLAASGERSSALTVFLQGNANLPSGTVYGDGLRCASGNLIRLYSKNAVGGAASAPQGADLSITARSAAKGDPIATGTSRFYLAAFRDPVIGFCPSSTFNSTNGVRITW